MLPLADPPDSGPAWLQARRAAALSRLADAELPSFEEEVWRYSLIDEFDLTSYHQRTDGVTTTAPDLPWSGESTATVLCIDGMAPQVVNLDDRLEAKGLIVRWAGEDDEVRSAGSGRVPDVFADLNAAYGPGPLLIATRAGLDVEAPIVVHHFATTPNGASYPRVVVDAAENSSLSVIEVWHTGAVAAFVAPVTEITVGPSARVNYMNLQDHGREVWQIGSLVTEVRQQGTLNAALGGFGGHYARLRTDCRLTGRGATGNLLAAFFANQDQVLDFRTFQDHIAPDTTSDLLFKGAVDDRSRSVYTGLIRVGKDAKGTNAFQTNRNIKLSEDAWAESVPNLEIENNDVHCSHASTVGPVDPDHRFYLESRGVPTQVAERLLVAGFFDEVIRRLPEPAAAAWVRDVVAEKVRKGVAA